METLLFVYILYVLIAILIFCLIISFYIWMIKKGVKNAIKETLYSVEFREQLKNDITYAIISANRQNND